MWWHSKSTILKLMETDHCFRSSNGVTLGVHSPSVCWLCSHRPWWRLGGRQILWCEQWDQVLISSTSTNKCSEEEMIKAGMRRKRRGWEWNCHSLLLDFSPAIILMRRVKKMQPRYYLLPKVCLTLMLHGNERMLDFNMLENVPGEGGKWLKVQSDRQQQESTLGTT